MAGVIAFSPDCRLSMSGWFFRWALSVVSDEADSPTIAAAAEVAAAVGWFSTEDLSDDDARVVRRIIRERLSSLTLDRYQSVAPDQLAATMELADQIVAGATGPSDTA